MALWLRQSTASQEIPLGYFVDSTDGNTEETGLTIGSADVKLWKAGASTLANCSGGSATHISNGIYYVTLDATDTNTLGPMVVFAHVSGALTVKQECFVVTSNVFDSLVSGSDTLDVTATGGTVAAVSGAVGSVTGSVGGSVTGSVGSVAGAVGSVTGSVGGSVTGSVASVVGAVGSVTGSVGGSVTGSVGSVVGAVGSVTGNLGGSVTGSVGSVAGAVASVSGAVGSVTGSVGGSVTGSVGSVAGAVGSVTGNIGGSVTGSVASVAGAVASVSGAVGSVTGNIGGSVTGSVASVVGAVGSVTGNIGGSVTAVGNIADAVWDEALSGHLGAGSTGEALNAAGAAGDPWTTTLPGAYTGSQAGKMLSDIITDTNELQGDWTDAGRLDAILDTVAADVVNLDGAAMRGTDSAALAATALSTATWTTARAGYLDELAAANIPADLDAVLADTNELQAAWADGGRLDLILDARAAEATVAALNDLSAADVNAQMVDVVGTDVIPDSLAADGSRPTINQALLMITRFLGEAAAAGSTLTIRKEDGSTSAATFTLTLDGSNVTGITRAT